jgi:hypothetical protein
VKTKSIILLQLSLVFATFGQQSMHEVFLSASVLIKLSNGGEASGFFYADSINCYLVTAKHVFFDMKSNRLLSETADLISYPRDPYKDPSNVLRCDLKLLLDGNLVRYHRLFDVAVAQIGHNEKSDSVNAFIQYNAAITKPNPQASRINPFKKENTLVSKEVAVGTEVYIAGYPSSIGITEMPQLESTQPLLRKGIVAGKNHRRQTIILDCPVYFGNSGGPVMASLSTSFKTELRLIGIVSEFVPFEEKWINDKYKYANVEFSNSGYSIVAPIEVMLEMIAEFKAQ